MKGALLERFARGELVVERCSACGHAQLYPRGACARCMSETVSLEPASGRGTVYTWTVVHRAATPELQAEAPYVLALVDLDEGPRIMARASAPVRVGERVRARFRQVSGAMLPMFEPVDAADESSP